MLADIQEELTSLRRRMPSITRSTRNQNRSELLRAIVNWKQTHPEVELSSLLMKNDEFVHFVEESSDAPQMFANRDEFREALDLELARYLAVRARQAD